MPGPSGLQWSPFPRLEGPGGSGLDLGPPTTLSPDPSVYGAAMDNVSIEPAVQDPGEIPQPGRRRRRGKSIREVSAEIARLFKDDPDLRSDFRVFMPEKNQVPFDDADEGFLAAPSDARRTRSNTPLDRSTRRKPDVSLATATEAAATVPQKRKCRANEREREREREIAPKTGSAQRAKQTSLAVNGSGTTLERVASPSFSLRQQQLQQQQQYAAASIAIPGLDELTFLTVSSVRSITADAFNEFLRLVNLFMQELIDTARLVREARNFLGDGELMRHFMEILGWDDGRERERWMLEEQQQQQAWARAQGQHAPSMPLRPGRINTGLQLGSYRRMPPTEAQWISHPTWSSEDSGFITQKKNVYEEARSRSETAAHALDRPMASRTDHQHPNRPLALQKGHPHPKRPLTPWTGPDQTINTSNGPVALQNGRSRPGQATGARSDHQCLERTARAPKRSPMPRTAAHALDRPLAPQSDHQRLEPTTHTPKGCSCLGRPLAPRSDHQHLEWTTRAPKRPLTPWTGLSHPEQTTNTSNGLLHSKKAPCANGCPCLDRHWRPKQTTTPRMGHRCSKKAAHAANGSPCPGQTTGAPKSHHAANGSLALQKAPKPRRAAHALDRPLAPRADDEHLEWATGASKRPPPPRAAPHALDRPLAPQTDDKHLEWATGTPKRLPTPRTAPHALQKATHTANGCPYPGQATGAPNDHQHLERATRTLRRPPTP
ncbi:hypothetical protein BU15DRAFT_73520 [Melanogaster broomeanus]|nr:hypothetical protein BU15DRAFT_73520 [Melanogaster broomeanus]